VFAELLQGTGKHRHNPFIITICKPGTDLTEADFNVENGLGNNFVAHIADFYYNDVYYETDSAYFADCPGTTEISLSSFTAKASNGRVKLKWVTETEINNAGFNIWRSEVANGEYVKLNEEIIAAKGSETKGATYVFIDNIAKNRKTYFYKLEDIDGDGKSTFNGPESATPRWIYRMKK
jgi:hypothetical protein